MPIYEYQCDTCEEVTIAIKSMDSRDDTVPCEICGGTTYRIMSMPAKPTSEDYYSVKGRVKNSKGEHYHEQAGIWYKNGEDLDRKAAAKGLIPVGSPVRRSSPSKKVEEAQKLRQKHMASYLEKKKAGTGGGQATSKEDALRQVKEKAKKS
jgi:putative FmdB family regulatory protein